MDLDREIEAVNQDITDAVVRGIRAFQSMNLYVTDVRIDLDSVMSLSSHQQQIMMRRVRWIVQK